MASKYRTKGVHLNEYDRRRKLTDAQREEIRKAYVKGKVSYGMLADAYGVSRSTIHLIVDEEAAERHRANERANWTKYKKTKEAHKKSMENLRHYRRTLIDDGKIKI